MESHITRDGVAQWHLHLDARPSADSQWITGPPHSDHESADDQFRLDLVAEGGAQTATIIMTRYQLSRIAVDSAAALAP